MTFVGKRTLRMSRDSMASVLILAIPAFAAFIYLFPGYFQADHQTTIAKIAAGIPSQWHSLTWGYLAFPFIYYSPHYSVYGIVQLAIFVICAYRCASRLKRLGLLRWTTPLCVFFGLFPTFLLYNLLWGTDLCFAYALMMLTSLLIELSMRKEEALRDRSFCLSFVLALIVTALLRKNAILINVFLCLLLPLMYKGERARAATGCIVSTVIALLIYGFFFPVVMGVVTPSASQELLSVPSEQIARVYKYAPEDVPSEVDAVLTKDRTAEEWAKSYIPYLADGAKKGQELTPEFLRAWLQLGLRKPGTYLKAYKELMYPYWTFGKARENRYGIGFTTDFGVHDDFTRVFSDQLRKEYVQQFDRDLKRSRQFLWPQRIEKWVEKRLNAPLRWVFYTVFFNRGLPLAALLLGALLSVVKGRGKEYLTVVMPSLCVVLSLLIFSPVASFRYVLSCYYALPLIVVAVFGWFAPSTHRG